MKEEKWKTKEGVEVKVKDMETSHIKNSMKMIERKSTVTTREYFDSGYDGDSWVPDFILVERIATITEIKKHSPIYNQMAKELKRRLSKLTS